MTCKRCSLAIQGPLKGFLTQGEIFAICFNVYSVNKIIAYTTKLNVNLLRKYLGV